MNKNKIKNEHFEILRKIQKEPSRSQREMAIDLGFSLGKFNYCLKALQAKGLVKINNFGIVMVFSIFYILFDISFIQIACVKHFLICF